MKKQSLKTIKRKLDTIISLQVRKEEITCFTCEKFLPFEKRQAGHYISRRFLAVRWERDNLHTQCVACNIFQKGAMAIYAAKMYRIYGKKRVNQLLEQRKQKITREQMLKLLEKL